MYPVAKPSKSYEKESVQKKEHTSKEIDTGRKRTIDKVEQGESFISHLFEQKKPIPGQSLYENDAHSIQQSCPAGFTGPTSSIQLDPTKTKIEGLSTTLVDSFLNYYNTGFGMGAERIKDNGYRVMTTPAKSKSSSQHHRLKETGYPTKSYSTVNNNAHAIQPSSSRSFTAQTSSIHLDSDKHKNKQSFTAGSVHSSLHHYDTGTGTSASRSSSSALDKATHSLQQSSRQGSSGPTSSVLIDPTNLVMIGATGAKAMMSQHHHSTETGPDIDRKSAVRKDANGFQHSSTGSFTGPTSLIPSKDKMKGSIPAGSIYSSLHHDSTEAKNGAVSKNALGLKQSTTGSFTGPSFSMNLDPSKDTIKGSTIAGPIHSSLHHHSTETGTGADMNGSTENQLLVKCGDKEGMLFRDKLAKGVKCIKSNGRWFLPSDFERFGGREGTKNWKISIRLQNIPLKDHIKTGKLQCPRAMKHRDLKSSNQRIKKGPPRTRLATHSLHLFLSHTLTALCTLVISFFLFNYINKHK